ncbi:MAG: SpoIVB peptidase [Lachnospiraceae bacterium]|nr:SpoIVB peptidase [Lachnospiraceae bacterium]
MKGCEVVREKSYRRILVVILALVTILETGFSIEKRNAELQEKLVSAENVSNTAVILGGMPVGIYLKTEGVLILGTEAIENVHGTLCEPAKNIVKSGDYIIGINGDKIESKRELLSAISKLENSQVVLAVRRDDEEIEVKLNAIEVNRHKYNLGIWVKDSVQGLGTITYLKENGEYGALGHGIYGSEGKELLEIRDGGLYNTELLGITKGEKGTPGGIEAVILYNTNNYLGGIDENTDIGIFGKIAEVEEITTNPRMISIARKKDIKVGEATILCTLQDTIEEYSIKIEQVDYFLRDKNKGMVIRITDERLLKKTGGIVQGMSGSPIIQDGKLVGAVTHVLVNDPTRGYGIFIENMLEAAG